MLCQLLLQCSSHYCRCTLLKQLLNQLLLQQHQHQQLLAELLVAAAAASCCSRIPANLLVTGTRTRDASACALRMAHGGAFGLPWAPGGRLRLERAVVRDIPAMAVGD